MSQENVELMRSILAGWERGDYDSTEWADPEIEYVVADGPEPGNGRGIAWSCSGLGRLDQRLGEPPYRGG